MTYVAKLNADKYQPIDSAIELYMSWYPVHSSGVSVLE